MKILQKLIKNLCKKKLVFASPLLHFGLFREVWAPCTHWQNLQFNSDSNALQRLKFTPSHNVALIVIAILILLMFSLSIKASDLYVTTSNLTIRSGTGTYYRSIVVLQKGDTVKLLENPTNYYVKIQYNDNVGYVVKSHLRLIELETIENEIGNEKFYPFVIFLFLLLIVVALAIILKQNGDKYRNKFTVTLLSFFFGVFGLQKFYLGESNKGVISILYCWTFIPLLIGFIDFVKFVTMNNIKFNDIYNLNKKLRENIPTIVKKPEIKQNHFQRNASTYQVTKKIQIYNATDESIIDITEEKLDLAVGKNYFQKEALIEPPFWGQTYVYSFEEIRNATQEQKNFYYYLKNKVFNGEFVDIQGNTNYAFILYFDFLNDYQSHRDIKLLEEQFKIIGLICPKTKSYTFRLLQDELRKRNDSYSIDKLKDLEEPRYQFEQGYTDFNPDLYKLGNQYKDKLGLSKQEINWLNKFYNPSNVFLSIEGCCIATITQYVTLLNEFDERLKKEDTTLEKEVTYFRDKLRSLYINRNSTWDYYDATYLGNHAESDIYLVLFKKVENSVRDSFSHKRKVSGDFPNADKILSAEFESRIGNLFNELIEEFKGNVGKPDLETQIALNIQNVARWQIEIDELKKTFKPELKNDFIDGINHLEETNQKNPNIENIFFEASKFIATYDKAQSLNYYAKYIYYDLKSKSFDNKELTKTVQKSLFKTQEQLEDFKEVISELIKTSDIGTALEKITKIYVPKRKKIHLDKTEIKEVEQKHEGTVDLLNEYLNTDNEETITAINIIPEEDNQVTIISTEEKQSIFISEINIGKVQEELIKKIVTNSFKIYQDEVNKFAYDNQMFKNQLIDSINESCAEYLDGEALIEEDGDIYIMEESYFKIITK